MSRNFSPSDELAFSTVRIECQRSSGKQSVGTGFFFSFTEVENRAIPIIVSNKHVVKDATRGIFHLTVADDQGLPKIGEFGTVVLDNFARQWIPHPEQDVDLCAMPVAPLLNQAERQGVRFFYRSFHKNHVASPQLLADLTALEEIVMIGYPVGIWDSFNNMPIFRRGITATNPNLDYNGRKEFLIDCACFPGSSGSPVLLYNFGNYRDKAGNTVIGTRIALLGVLYAGPQFTVEGEIKIVSIPTQMQPVPISQIPTNLGVVVKASKILDFEQVLTAMAKGT